MKIFGTVAPEDISSIHTRLTMDCVRSTRLSLARQYPRTDRKQRVIR